MLPSGRTWAWALAASVLHLSNEDLVNKGSGGMSASVATRALVPFPRCPSTAHLGWLAAGPGQRDDQIWTNVIDDYGFIHGTKHSH